MSADRSLIQLSPTATIVDPDPDAWSHARAQFAAHHHLLLRGFLDGPVLAALQASIARASFRERIATQVEPPAVDYKLHDDRIHARLLLLVNHPRIFDRVCEVSGCEPIGCFAGAVYRLVPGAGHRDSWHDDLDGNRIVGLSINLSAGAFDGGELRLRDRHTGRILFTVANTGPGDALLFRLSPDHQHCIAPMKTGPPKDAFAGWFCRRPAFLPSPDASRA